MKREGGEVVDLDSGDTHKCLHIINTDTPEGGGHVCLYGVVLARVGAVTAGPASRPGGGPFPPSCCQMVPDSIIMK